MSYERANYAQESIQRLNDYTNDPVPRLNGIATDVGVGNLNSYQTNCLLAAYRWDVHSATVREAYAMAAHDVEDSSYALSCLHGIFVGFEDAEYELFEWFAAPYALHLIGEYANACMSARVSTLDETL